MTIPPRPVKRSPSLFGFFEMPHTGPTGADNPSPKAGELIPKTVGVKGKSNKAETLTIAADLSRVAIDSAGLGEPMVALHVPDKLCALLPDFIHYTASGGQ